MTPEELSHYISEQKSKRVTDDIIRAELLKSGWTEQQINEGLAIPAAVLNQNKKLYWVVPASLLLAVLIVGGVLFFLHASSQTVRTRVAEGGSKALNNPLASDNLSVPTFTSTKLFTLQPGDKVDNPVLFDAKDSPYFVIINNATAFVHGQKTKTYKFIGQFAYNFKLGHVGFVAEKNDGMSAVVYNGKEVETQYLHPSDIEMPLHGLQPRYAFIADQGDKKIVVIDGKPTPVYDSIGRIQFTDDGKHFMYEATNGIESFVVFDGVKSLSYSQVKLVPNSWAGGRNIFEAKYSCNGNGSLSDCPSLMVVDGKEGKQYDEIGEFSTHASPDGLHFAYTGKIGNKVVAVIDGKESRPYDIVHGEFNTYGGNFFTPIGNHTVFLAVDNKQFFVVKDGKEGKRYPWVTSLSVSNDGSHVAYVASSNCSPDEVQAMSFDPSSPKKCATLVVKDEKEIPTADQASQVVMSPDDSHFAYATSGNCAIPKDDPSGYGLPECTRNQVVADGSAGKIYHQIFGDLFYSNKGKHLAYNVGDVQKNEFKLVVDGHEYNVAGSAGSSDNLYSLFSVDDNHTAVVESVGSKSQLSIDGQKPQIYDSIFARGFSEDSKKFTLMYKQGNDVYLGEYSF